METEHAQPHRLAHPSHLTVAPLVERDLDHRSARHRIAKTHSRRRAVNAGFELDAAREAIELRGIGRALEQHAVEFREPIARVHEVMREVAVVGHDE
jgi:hypothetical protein